MGDRASAAKPAYYAAHERGDADSAAADEEERAYFVFKTTAASAALARERARGAVDAASAEPSYCHEVRSPLTTRE